jgi:hypothetical protein
VRLGHRHPIALLAAVALFAGCGSDDDPPSGGRVYRPPETATATAPASPPEEVLTEPETAPPATVTAPAPVPTSPEEAPGGAGDEEGIQVPARFVLQAGGTLSPDGAQVPAFLGVAVTVANQDAVAHRLEVGGQSAELPAGQSATVTLPGRGEGEVPILIDGERAGVLRFAKETP